MRIRPSVVLIAAALAWPAAGATIGGVSVADSARAGEATLVLNGAAMRTKFMFKVYVGALYLQEKNRDAASILAADSPRRMEMHFVRGVSAERLCSGWKDGLAANTPQASKEVVQGFGELCSALEAVEDGTVVSITYLPGSGTNVEVAGKAKVTIAGKAFADAVLACWIGPKPDPGEEFKKAVLGG